MNRAALAFRLVVWFVLIAGLALAYPLFVEAWQLAPFRVMWDGLMTVVGVSLLVFFDWRRRTDRVRGAKDRLDYINRGGTQTWRNQEQKGPQYVR